MERFKVDKVYITATTPEYAKRLIVDAVCNGRNEYICVSNVRTVEYASTHPDYAELMNNAYMCLPDGAPLTWLSKLHGRRDVKRTNGPDLFMSMLSKPEMGIKHFLLGDTDETLIKIKDLYPNSNIVGSYSPPFTPLEEYNLQTMADMINQSDAHIVWISLHAPKQDFLAQKLQPLLDKKICIGVGAAFRFATGVYKQPNNILQKMGLSGLFFRKIDWNLLKLYVNHLLSVTYWGGDFHYKIQESYVAQERVMPAFIISQTERR